MRFETVLLENSDIQLIDGDRGKNYPKQADFSEDGFCLFLSAKNVTSSGFEFSERSYISSEKDELLRAGKLQRGDIVVTTRGTIGNVAYYGDDVPFDHIRINSGMMIFRADENRWNKRFLYFLLTSSFIRQQIASLTSGSAVPQLPARDLKKFSLPNIPKIIQDKIERVVGDLSDKIKFNRQTNQTLEQMAQAIFKSWFVDFDPVKAKIEALTAGGNADDAELAAMSVISAKTVDELNSLKASNPEAFNKLAQTASLFPAAMQGSELGEIPEGWEVSEIGNEVIVVGGGTPSTKNTEFWEDGTIHWTTPKDMSGLNCKVLTNTDRKITEAGLKKISSGLLSKNTVLMSSRAPVGYLALAKIPVAINQGYIAMKCEGRLSPEYVLLWCEHNMEEIKQRASGTTFAEISKANFKPIPVIVPTKSIIDTFTVQVSDIYNIVHANVLQSETLSISRDLLLPQLLSGELSDVFKDGE
ncbi:restriction endonuclease subunit S [Vibrio cholerae]|uniref:restriction endonuclease subunit S n=1 Tax=Vibrio cholerae TaxID=666 RepID=UPI003080548D